MSKRKPKPTKKEARATQAPQVSSPVAELKRIALGLRTEEERATLQAISKERTPEKLIELGNGAQTRASAVQQPGSEPRRRLGLADSASDIACVAGCSFCCHMSVSTDIPQVAALARAIRNKPPEVAEAILSRLRASWPAISSIALFERARRRIACAVLDPKSETCLVHEGRPTSCRAWNSIDANQCERGLSDPRVTITHDGVDREFALAVGKGVSDGLSKAGLDAEQYVLDGALLIALELGEDGLVRWLAGEDVFAAARWSLRPTAEVSLAAKT